MSRGAHRAEQHGMVTKHRWSLDWTPKRRLWSLRSTSALVVQRSAALASPHCVLSEDPRGVFVWVLFHYAPFRMHDRANRIDSRARLRLVNARADCDHLKMTHAIGIRHSD